MFGGTTAAPVTALAAVREMSFAAFRAISGWPENTYINPQRCVWVVTVHAPMAVKVPPGASPRSVDVYSIVFDVASGTMIALMEGKKLVD
jgi:hypothetical protein